MLIKDVIDVINMYADEHTQLEWDNSGLQIGDPMDETSDVTVCLDVTEKVVREAEDNGSRLIVSHHPLLFEPLTRVTEDRRGRLVKRIIRDGISVYSTHTCFDMCSYGMNAYIAFKLGIDVDGYLEETAEGAGIGIAGNLEKETSLRDFCVRVARETGSSVIHLSSFASDDRRVRRAAFCGGSGRDYIERAAELGADVYVTSDVTNSGFMKAADLEMPVVTLTHFETEKSFIRIMADILRNELPRLDVHETEQGDLERYILL